MLDSLYVRMRCASSFWLLLIFFVQASQCKSVSVAEAVPRPFLVSLSQPTEPLSRSGTSVFSDFDGDGTADLAIGRFDGHNYNIDIQLSTKGGTPLLASGQVEPGICLLVRDVDLDNDQDIVLVNYTSFLPLAIWLNDGSANFKQADRWLWLNIITTDNPSSLYDKNFFASPISLTENDPLPLNRSVRGFLLTKLQIRNSVARESQNPHSLVFLYHPSLRGPPLCS